MPEEKKKEAEPPKSGGGLGRLLLLVGVILVAAIGGLATYLFVLAPMLKDPNTHAEARAHEEGDQAIPHDAVPVDLASVVVNVVRDGNSPAAILQFGVTLECNNEETAKLVEAHKARFIDIINKLHDSRTRSELDDTLLIKESIQRQALQKTNELLKKLQEKSKDEIKITAVLHHTFVVQDPT
jgi:flagellar basal body-associated protein FliL